MNSIILNDFARTVLQKNSLEECSIHDLRRVTEQYPFFSVGQFLLAQKLKETGDPRYTEQLQKLSLYIQDPLWLEQLLEQKGEMSLYSSTQQEKLEKEEPIQPVLPAVEVSKSIEPAIEPSIPIEQPKEIIAQKSEPVNVPELTFEPYHTVDYFASQGIRAKEEEQPGDKFGQQLKSFTEWLKTLKKLPVAEITVHVDSKSEQKVEQMAEHSIEDREVVTEAMAEVWEKQGNAEKAIATYRKLSLLNPSKSSYFAAKIEQLKTS